MYNDTLKRIRATFPWLNHIDTIETQLLSSQTMNEYQTIARKALYDTSFQTFCLGNRIPVGNTPFIDLLLKVAQQSITQTYSSPKYVLYVRYVYQLMTS